MGLAFHSYGSNNVENSLILIGSLGILIYFYSNDIRGNTHEYDFLDSFLLDWIVVFMSIALNIVLISYLESYGFLFQILFQIRPLSDRLLSAYIMKHKESPNNHHPFTGSSTEKITINVCMSDRDNICSLYWINDHYLVDIWLINEL